MLENAAHSETIDKILDVAELHIRRFGIRRASLGDIARDAKVSRGTIYNRFQDKETLVDAVFSRNFERFQQDTERAIQSKKTLVDKVTAAILYVREHLDKELFMDLPTTEPDTASMIIMHKSDYAKGLAIWSGHIEAAIDAGELRKDLDIKAAEEWIVRIVLSTSLFPILSVNLDSARDVKQFLEQHLMQGLR